ncbi:MAG TPA: tetratricopeptide repeat protein [Pyrinomonadaceae bacterium]|nr:tetratricopeptide repeat protein [Pyrinomonadaceae bacterium]
MVKLRLFFVAIFLCGLGPASAWAQTLSYADNSRNNRASERVVVSPEARAEAKRLYKEGVKYGVARLFAQAAEMFERAVKLDPQNADAHFALGHAYFDLKQWKKAVGSFERAVELNPKDQQAVDYLALSRTMAHGGPPPGFKRTETAPQTQPQAQPKNVQVSMSVKPASPPKTEPAPKTDPKTEEPPAGEVNGNTEVAEVNAAANEISLTKIYRVGPNDVLDIRISDSAQPESTLFTVTPSGFIEHPLLAEPLKASGLTVEEISARFESEIKRRALNDKPNVSVGVRDYASHTILVSGLVKDSGTKILRREAIPLYVVVADAQPLPEAGRATVLRNESNETFEIDLTETNDMNLLVRPGDVITLLPNVTQFVYIGGEVKLPGEKTYRRGLTLTQALIAAGGVTSKAKEASIARDDGKGFLAVTRYKLKEIESGKAQDPLVKAGDRITIKE